MQQDFTAANVAAQVEYLLDHPEAREEMIRGFQALKSRLGQGGAIERAADAVVEVLQSSQASPKGRLKRHCPAEIDFGDKQRGGQPHNPI